MAISYLESAVKQFRYYETLGRMVIERLDEEQIYKAPDAVSNSMAVMVNHLNGNMLSRWTDFLETDGEKDFRQRDKEFESYSGDKALVISKWKEGWAILFDTLEKLENVDMESIVYIRNEGHPIYAAINRQLCHYSYHVGQMVYLGRMLLGENWESLSIPKGKSKEYNATKFSKKRTNKHFTDDLLKDLEK